MVTLYNQSTNLQAQGKFAPGVNYRADIKRPRQSLIDMPDIKASFNIDLKPIADSMNYSARAQALAKKEYDKELLKVQKAEFLNNVATSLMENELAADQDAIDATAVDIKNREVIYRALKEGAIYQVTPSDISSVYPNYGASTFQATKDRLDWNKEIMKDEQERAKKLREAVPETRNLPYQSQVFLANYLDNNAANTEASYKKALQTNSEADMATAQMYADTMAYNQGATTFSNVLSGLKSGQITSSEANAQVEQSIFQSLNGRISSQMALEATKRAMDRLKPTLDTYSKMKPEEIKMYSDLLSHEDNRVYAAWMAKHPDVAISKVSGAVDLTKALVEQYIADDANSYIYSEIPGYTYTEDGKTITVPASQGITGVKTITGETINFNKYVSEEYASQFRAPGYTRLSQIASSTPLPVGNYTNGMLQKSFNIDSRNQSVITTSADTVRNMSPDDQKIHLANRENLVQMVESPIYQKNVEANGNVELQNQTKYFSSQTLGEKIVIGEGRFNTVPDWASTSSKLNSIEFLKPYLRVSKEGHLLLKDDVPGVLPSIAQTFTGKDVKEMLNTFNLNLDTFCTTPQEKRAVIDFELSGLGQIEEWDGSVGYSTKPTTVETLGSGLVKLSGEALQLAKKGLNQTGEFAGENIAEYVYNNPNKMEAVNKFIEDMRAIVDAWVSKTFSSTATEGAPKQSSIMTADEAFEALTKNKVSRVNIKETVEELKKTKPDSTVIKLDEDKQLRTKAVQNAEKIVQQTTLTDNQRKDVGKMLEDFKEKGWDGLAKWSGAGYLGGLAADLVIYQNYGLDDAMTSTGSRRGGAINQGLLALLIGAGEISSVAAEGAGEMLRDLWRGATLIVERATRPIKPNKSGKKM